MPLMVVAVAAPMVGVTSVGEVARATEPEPVTLAETNWLDEFEATTAALAGTDAPLTPVVLVATIEPEPETAKLAPVPTIMAAVVFVPPVSVLNAEPPPALPQSLPVPEIKPALLT